MRETTEEWRGVLCKSAGERERERECGQGGRGPFNLGFGRA